MLRTPRKPGWWMLYVLVPLMGGLLALEHGAPLSPRGHQYAQVGIVLFIYGLVWLWVSTRALAHDGQDEQSQEEMDTSNHMAVRSLESSLTPRHAYVRRLSVGHTKGRISAKADRREIRKCSLSLGRQSFHSQTQWRKHFP